MLVKLLEDTKSEIGERLNLLGRSVCEAEERERERWYYVCVWKVEGQREQSEALSVI